MTVIAAVAKNGVVFMGGDSAGVNSETEALGLCQETKVFRNGEYIAGVAGSSKINQALRYVNWPCFYRYEPQDIMKFAVKVLLPFFRETIQKAGISLDTPYEMLVGVRGRILHFYRNQVGEEQCSYDACGSGGQVARGALYVAQLAAEIESEVDAIRQVETALNAAERFCSGVRGPFVILENLK